MSLAILGIVLMLGASFLARRRALEAERRDRDRAVPRARERVALPQDGVPARPLPEGQAAVRGPGRLRGRARRARPDPGRAADGRRRPLPRDARHRVRPGREEAARRGGLRLPRGLPAGAAPVTRRGFSLVEMCVVVMIGVVLLFALLPVAMGLLRQQAGPERAQPRDRHVAAPRRAARRRRGPLRGRARLATLRVGGVPPPLPAREARRTPTSRGRSETAGRSARRSAGSPTARSSARRRRGTCPARSCSSRTSSRTGGSSSRGTTAPAPSSSRSPAGVRRRTRDEAARARKLPPSRARDPHGLRPRPRRPRDGPRDGPRLVAAARERCTTPPSSRARGRTGRAGRSSPAAACRPRRCASRAARSRSRRRSCRTAGCASSRPGACGRARRRSRRAARSPSSRRRRGRDEDARDVPDRPRLEGPSRRPARGRREPRRVLRAARRRRPPGGRTLRTFSPGATGERAGRGWA